MRKTKLFEVLFIFIFSLTPILWLRDSEIILGHDSGLRLDPLGYLHSLFYSWGSLVNFGYDWSLFKGFLITQAPEGIFTFLTNSIQIGQIMTFIFWFFLIGISMYIFINGFFKEKKYWFFRVFASTFYVYNFFILQAWFIAERGKFSIFASFPLGLLILYKTLTKEYSIRKGFVLFLIAFFFLNGGGNPSLFGSTIIAYFITFLYLTYIQARAQGIKSAIYQVKAVFLLFIAIFFVNAYWIIPQVYLFLNTYSSTLAFGGGVGGIILWESTISKYASFINLFRMQGIPDWYTNHHPYANLYLTNYSLIFLSGVPMLVLILALLKKGIFFVSEKINNLLFLLLLLFIIGFVFTAGSHPPLGFIYTFFIKTIPGFTIFRSGFYKFGLLAWFPFIVLVSYSLYVLLSQYFKNKVLYVGATLFSIFLLLIYHYPFFAGDFFNWKKPFTLKVKLPQYVTDISKDINQMPNDSRILLFPKLNPDFPADIYGWGFFSLDLLPRLTTNKAIIANDAIAPKILSDVYIVNEQNNKDLFNRLTGLLGIDTFLWRNDAIYDNEPSDQLKIEVQNNFKNFSSISKVTDKSKWLLYKNDSDFITPLFYVPSEVYQVSAINESLIDLLTLTKTNQRSLYIFNQEIDSTIFDKEFIAPECILCMPGEFISMVDSVDISNNDIFPDSLLYIFFNDTDEKKLRMLKNNAKETIILKMQIAAKKLANTEKISERRKKDASDNTSQDTIRQYKKYMTEAIVDTANLGTIDRNKFYIKLLANFTAHKRYLSQLLRNRNIYSVSELKTLSLFIKQSMENIRSKSWMPLDASEMVYTLDIRKSGKYSLKFIGKTPEKVLLDNHSVNNDGEFITKGGHKLTVKHQVPQNVLLYKDQGEIILDVGQVLKIPFAEYDSKEVYHIAFDYKIRQGIAPYLSILEIEDKKILNAVETQLEVNDLWTSYTNTFIPSPQTSNAMITFSIIGFDDEPTIMEYKNLKVFKSIQSKPYFVFENSNKTIVSPKIIFTKINPTFSIVHIENAQTPFLLQFSNAYHAGWKAYISPFIHKIDKTQEISYFNGIVTKASIHTNFLEEIFSSFTIKPIEEKNHFTSNGYANGWLIDKKGSYDVLIVYWPQVIFYIGLFTTILFTVILFIFFAPKKFR